MTFNFCWIQNCTVSEVRKISNILATNSKFTLKLLPFGLNVTNLLKSEITFLVKDKWVRWVGRVTVVVCPKGPHKITTGPTWVYSKILILLKRERKRATGIEFEFLDDTKYRCVLNLRDRICSMHSQINSESKLLILVSTCHVLAFLELWKKKRQTKE